MLAIDAGALTCNPNKGCMYRPFAGGLSRVFCCSGGSLVWKHSQLTLQISGTVSSNPRALLSEADVRTTF